MTKNNIKIPCIVTIMEIDPNRMILHLRDGFHNFLILPRLPFINDFDELVLTIEKPYNPSKKLRKWFKKRRGGFRLRSYSNKEVE